ncbi:MAG: PEGA domain-containing protein [Myxococcota bacterium]|nr:PEGA domain-containing protein [Myxococcota bacterium]
MSRVGALPVLAVVALGGLPAAGASAQQAVQEGGTERTRQEAREHYQRGRRLLERGRTAEALEAFARSYAAYPHWATSNNLGVCHDRLGRPSDALRLYELALREGGDEIPERQRNEIGRRVADLRLQLGIREPTTGRVSVTSTPPGATVSIDGREIGAAPVEVEVEPGTHAIAVAMPGFRPNAVETHVAAGEAVVVAMALEAEARRPAHGTLSCSSDPPGANVSIDGKAAGRTPVAAAFVPEGERLVRFETADGRTWEERVQVAADATVNVSVEFGGAGVHQGWFWGTMAAALALGAGAAATGVYGKTLHDEFSDPGTARDRIEDIQPVGRALMLSTDVMAAAAGALAVAALALGFVAEFGEPETRGEISFGTAPDESGGAAPPPP